MRLNHESVNKSYFYFLVIFQILLQSSLQKFYVELLHHIPECNKHNGLRCREKISGVSHGRRLSQVSNQTRVHSPTP